MAFLVFDAKEHPERLDEIFLLVLGNKIGIDALEEHFSVDEAVGLEEDGLLMFVQKRCADGEDEMAFLVPLPLHDGQEASGNRVHRKREVKERYRLAGLREREIKRATGRERTRRTPGCSDDVLQARRRDARTHPVLLSRHSGAREPGRCTCQAS